MYPVQVWLYNVMAKLYQSTYINHSISDFKEYATPDQKFCINTRTETIKIPTYSVQVWLYNGKVVLDHINHPILDLKNMPFPTRNSASRRGQRLSNPMYPVQVWLYNGKVILASTSRRCHSRPENPHHYKDKGYQNPIYPVHIWL